MKYAKRILSAILSLTCTCTCAAALLSCSGMEELSATVLPVKDGKDGIITIVHDDGDRATARYLKEQFDENGLCGSFAMIADRVVDASGNPKPALADWKEIMDSGYFDILNHTQTHVWYGFTDKAESGTYIKKDGSVVQYSYEDGHMTNEIVGAAERLRKVFSEYDQRVLCYVIPGFTNAPGYDGRTDNAKKIIRDNFICSRNTSGVGTFGDQKVACLNNIDKINFEDLNCMMVTAKDDYATRWFNYVDDIIEYHGWGIYCFHSIVETETSNTNNVARSKATELFRYIGLKVNDGSLWCAGLTDATLYTKEYENAKVNFEQEKNKITVSLRDKLDNAIYDMPLTVKVEVYSKWKSVSVSYDGETEVYKPQKDADGRSYILIDIIPDRGAAVLTEVK